MFILFWFGFCIAVGVFASNKGRNGFGWFFLAVLISPMIAGIALALAKDIKQEDKIDKVKKDTDKLEDRVVTNERINEKRFQAIENGGDRKNLENGNSLDYLEEATKECPICGREIKADAIKCKYCKNLISSENLKKCPYCKEMMPIDDTVCPHCDAIVTDMEEL